MYCKKGYTSVDCRVGFQNMSYNPVQVGVGFNLPNREIRKNKIEGTLILKLAEVKRKKNPLKNSSKNS